MFTWVGDEIKSYLSACADGEVLRMDEPTANLLPDFFLARRLLEEMTFLEKGNKRKSEVSPDVVSTQIGRNDDRVLNLVGRYLLPTEELPTYLGKCPQDLRKAIYLRF